MNTLKTIGLFCAMIAFGGVNIVVAAGDSVEEKYEQAISDIKGIIEQRNKLRNELAILRTRFGMQKDKYGAIEGVVKQMFPGESTDIVELIKKLAATQVSLQDAITINQGINADAGSGVGTIVGNVKQVIDQLEKKNKLVSELNTLLYGTTPQADKEQPLGQLLQDGIVALIQKQNDTIARLGKAQKDSDSKGRSLQKARLELRKTKKELNRLDRLKDQLNIQISDLAQESSGQDGRIKDLMNNLKDANNRLDQLRGYFVDLVRYAEKNKE